METVQHVQTRREEQCSASAPVEAAPRQHHRQRHPGSLHLIQKADANFMSKAACASCHNNSFAANGVVYEKDLGPKMLDEFKKMERYHPDKSWTPVEEPPE